MPWKRNEDKTLAIDDNGNPIRVEKDGKEYPMTDQALDSTLVNLATANSESAERKRKLRELEAKFKPFEEIEDPEEYLTAANKALETIKNLDDKKLIDANEVALVKKQVSDAYEKKLKESTDTISAKDQQIYKLTVGSAFKGSKFIKEKTLLPADIAEAYYNKHFKPDGDSVVGYLNDSPILSQENPGQTAHFDEAISIIINADPNKEAILKAVDGGTGSQSSTQNVNTGGNWRNMSPTEKLNHAHQTG